jgi:hypothetical protein
MRSLNAIAWIANFVGMAGGLLVLLMGIARNHQGEYIETSAWSLDFNYAIGVFVIVYLEIAIATAILLSFLLLSVQGLFLLAGWLLRRST